MDAQHPTLQPHGDGEAIAARARAALARWTQRWPRCVSDGRSARPARAQQERQQFGPPMNVANLQLEGLLVVLSELARLFADGDPTRQLQLEEG
ncbi:hypothetical protein ABIE41_000207 [Bosea sp. OAE506]